MITLTTKQQKAQEDVLELLKTEDIVVLTGKAGTGKTTLADSIAKNFKDQGRGSNIVCSAPTNKALHVLRKKIFLTKGMKFKTVHGALHLKRKIDFKSGAVSFAPENMKSTEPLKDVKFIIIDEASMIGKQLLSFILKYTQLHGVKLLFLGDTAQLPPVGEKESDVFVSDYPTIELTEIIRQGEGNPIIELSQDLDIVQKQETNRTAEGQGYLFTNNVEKVIKELAEVNGTDNLKYLAWTNKEVDKINRQVREAIYGAPKKIELEETLVFNAPYKEKFFTNEEIRVKALETTTKAFKYVNSSDGHINPKEGETAAVGKIDLKCYVIQAERLFVEEGAEPAPPILVLHEDSEADFQKLKKNLQRKARFAEIRWVDFYHFIEQFADLKYNHAITVHKSQGSTYTRAIVNVKNIKMNRDAEERKKLLYTAVTRSSQVLILYNV